MGDQMEGVRDWYNGYRMGPHVIYNPWSVLQFLNNAGRLQACWVNTSSNDLIRQQVLTANAKVPVGLEQLMRGKTIQPRVTEHAVFGEFGQSDTALWSFLLLSGYLTVVEETWTGRDFVYELGVPNREVAWLFRKSSETGWPWAAGRNRNCCRAFRQASSHNSVTC